MKKPAPDGDGRKPTTIMVIDDDDRIRHICRRSLTQAGYEVIEASSGEQALEILKSGRLAQIVLQDIRMPGMGGIASLQAIKELNPLCEVIMVTASLELEDTRQALRLGAYDYLLKPFDIQDLMTVVGRASEKVELIRQNLTYQLDLERQVEIKSKQVIEKEQKNRKLFLSIVLSMAEAMESRDKYTEDHARRIAEHGVLMARKLGLDEKQTQDVYLAGILHDIGKIGIPDNVLHKPDKLTNEEWELVKMHPLTGAKILEKINGIDEIVKLVRAHHERYDGKGYPDGLKKEEIPLGSRILAVADSYDAMTTNRPYRTALSKETAISEIEKSSESQFDPRIAKAFLEIIRHENFDKINDKEIGSGPEIISTTEELERKLAFFNADDTGRVENTEFEI